MRALVRLAALIARVRVVVLRRGVRPSRLGVLAAGVYNQDDPRRDSVSRAAVVGTPIDGVLVVEAAAGRVLLDDLIAHVAGGSGCLSGGGVEDEEGWGLCGLWRWSPQVCRKVWM